MNRDLKLKMAGMGVRQWMVAAELDVAAETLCRWMRKPLSQERHEKIVAAIEKISKGESCDG